MKGDTLSDWMEYNGVNKKGDLPEFTQFIIDKGNEFEDKVVDFINHNIEKVVTISNKITPSTCDKTLEMMKQGVPIIHSAPVINKENKTHGIIDLLVRSDYVNKLVQIPSLTYKESSVNAPMLGKNNYHYVVIDVKYTTLKLCSDGESMRNYGNIPAYKAQCFIYTEAIGKLQGYVSPFAFIMGRRTSFTRGLDYNDYTPFCRLGKIDYTDKDRIYKHITKKGIDWVRDVRQNGASWSVNPPSRPELFPNMCTDSGHWQAEKRKIASEIGEITEIWNVGPKNRSIAIKEGITNWRDNRCSTVSLGINSNRSETIDKIIDINRQDNIKILPQVISGNMNDWKNGGNDLYVDFETLSDIFTPNPDVTDQRQQGIIFMIGVGWEEDGEWKHKTFTCRNLTYDEEFLIMNDFATFVKDRGNPKLHHWCADENFWKSAVERQLARLTKPGYILEERFWRIIDTNKQDEIKEHLTLEGWSDLCKLFQNEPIVLKDCFNYGLKNIAKAMKKHGMITVDLDSDCDSGTSAMVNAWKCYNTTENAVETDTMKDVGKYNEFDCKVLWEIITYLRNNHT